MHFSCTELEDFLAKHVSSQDLEVFFSDVNVHLGESSALQTSLLKSVFQEYTCSRHLSDHDSTLMTLQNKRFFDILKTI